MNEYAYIWLAGASVINMLISGYIRIKHGDGWQFAAFCSMWCLGASILVLLASV